MKALLRMVIAAGIVVIVAGLSFNDVQAETTPGQSLQERIDQAVVGETIMIPAGTYEGPIQIDKSVKLESEGLVTLINTTSESAVLIKADHVQVKGITILDEAVKEAPSVLVNGNGVLLEELTITTGSDGILIRDANDGVVINNVVEWGADQVTSLSDMGNGIDLYNAHRVHIEGNTVKGLFDGIYLENSDDSMVLSNRIEHSRYGVHCMYTNRTIIRGNMGTMNITGAMVMVVSEVEVTGNTFTKQNENVNSQGILLFDAQNSTFTNNIVEGNRVGLYVEHSVNNWFENNSITDNFIGIQLLTSEQNTITANRFTGNVSDAMTQSSTNNDLFGNYWGAFQGIDADGDGSSDISYEMNPFFQGLIMKQPAFQLLFQNPGIGFLEGLYEANRLSWTTDHSPLMEPPKGLQSGNELGEGRRMSGILGALLIAITCAIIYTSRRKTVW